MYARLSVASDTVDQVLVVETLSRIYEGILTAEVEPGLRWGLLAVTSGLLVFLRGEELWGASSGLLQWVPVALAAFASPGSLVRLRQLRKRRGNVPRNGNSQSASRRSLHARCHPAA